MIWSWGQLLTNIYNSIKTTTIITEILMEQRRGNRGIVSTTAQAKNINNYYSPLLNNDNFYHSHNNSHEHYRSESSESSEYQYKFECVEWLDDTKSTNATKSKDDDDDDEES